MSVLVKNSFTAEISVSVQFHLLKVECFGFSVSPNFLFWLHTSGRHLSMVPVWDVEEVSGAPVDGPADLRGQVCSGQEGREGRGRLPHLAGG